MQDDYSLAIDITRRKNLDHVVAVVQADLVHRWRSEPLCEHVSHFRPDGLLRHDDDEAPTSPERRENEPELKFVRSPQLAGGLRHVLSSHRHSMGDASHQMPS